jgi:hypothetical protein
MVVYVYGHGSKLDLASLGLECTANDIGETNLNPILSNRYIPLPTPVLVSPSPGQKVV